MSQIWVLRDSSPSDWSPSLARVGLESPSFVILHVGLSDFLFALDSRELDIFNIYIARDMHFEYK